VTKPRPLFPITPEVVIVRTSNTIFYNMDDASLNLFILYIFFWISSIRYHQIKNSPSFGNLWSPVMVILYCNISYTITEWPYLLASQTGQRPASGWGLDWWKYKWYMVSYIIKLHFELYIELIIWCFLLYCSWFLDWNWYIWNNVSIRMSIKG
jgi:hypothetical protein